MIIEMWLYTMQGREIEKNKQAQIEQTYEEH